NTRYRFQELKPIWRARMSSHSITLSMALAISKCYRCTGKASVFYKTDLAPNEIINGTIRVAKRSGRSSQLLPQNLGATKDFALRLFHRYPSQRRMRNRMTANFQTFALHF